MPSRAIVLIPTYNEAGSILGLLRGILAQAPEIEALVIDDASPDGTADLVEAERARRPRIHLLPRPGKLGLGSAYLAGFRYGLEHGYPRIVTMDGDGSHDPAHLPSLLRGLDDHDLVIGSRYVPGGGIANWSWQRRWLSRFANAYTRLLLQLPIRDCTSGYRSYRSEVLGKVDPFAMRASGYSFLEEMAWRVHRAGLRIAEVPILFLDRNAGRSKINRSEIGKAAWHVLRTAARSRRRAARPGRASKGTAP